ncbi:MAG: hypothetical protein JHC31_06050 [Sulfurihydrogenibium sp.]|nr:hypothetical protein [Sulfurihydrogenibium sp.]
MFYNELVKEYEKYLKFNKIVREKTVEFANNETKTIVLTEIGILWDNEIVYKKINLKLPNSKIVKITFENFGFRARPDVPKVAFYRVYFNNSELKIEGMDTEVVIPLYNDFSFVGAITIENFERQLIIIID